MSDSLFRTKSIERLVAESEAKTLKRTLGGWSLVAIGIGAIIGAGLFVRTAAAIAGSRLESYEGAPHGLFLTDPERFNRDVLGFVRS